MIFTPSNILSVLRGFLVLLFLIDNPYYRCLAIFLAMITDVLDGYLARRWNMTSAFGAALDPLMDKFFVFFILGIFLKEQRLQVWQALSLMSRDFAVFAFFIYLISKKQWSSFNIQSFITGKVTTTIQFFVLLALTIGLHIPSYLYIAFIVLGFIAFIELYFISKRIPKPIG